MVVPFTNHQGEYKSFAAARGIEMSLSLAELHVQTLTSVYHQMWTFGGQIISSSSARTWESGSYNQKCFKTFKWRTLVLLLLTFRFNTKLCRFVSSCRDPLAKAVSSGGSLGSVQPDLCLSYSEMSSSFGLQVHKRGCFIISGSSHATPWLWCSPITREKPKVLLQQER